MPLLCCSYTHGLIRSNDPGLSRLSDLLGSVSILRNTDTYIGIWPPPDYDPAYSKVLN